MDRRHFLRTAGLAGPTLGFLSACRDGEQAARPTPVAGGPHRIGTISELTANPEDGPDIGWFHQRMAELGHELGRTYFMRHRYSATKTAILPALAEALVRDRVDLIMAINLRPAEAAKAATDTIPIIFHAKEDPVAAGLVQSFARPGGNLTGVGESRGASAGKRFSLLLEAFPWVRRVVVLFNPEATHEVGWQGYEEAARPLPIAVERLDMPWTPDVLPYLDRARAAGADAIVGSYGTGNLDAPVLARFTVAHRIPVFVENRVFVDLWGVLMSYGPVVTPAFRRMAEMADSILKGTPPADIPVDQPALFEFVINAATARQAGLTIPASVLAQATEVVG